MLQTLLGTLQLTSILMGYTNSVQIFHRDTAFLLQEEIPHVMVPFLDDIPLKGLTSMTMDSTKPFQKIREYSALSGSICITSIE